jgi:transposase
MQDVADQSAAPTTIGADLCAIFVSLELSQSTWLATSLSPGGGEKMSKHSVSAGDIAALLARFSELRRESVRADRKILPNFRDSRSGVGRLLDSPCVAE